MTTITDLQTKFMCVSPALGRVERQRGPRLIGQTAGLRADLRQTAT